MGNELTAQRLTITVYVWLPRVGQVGHASMCLENGTYISLWPGEDKMGKKKKRKKIKNIIMKEAKVWRKISTMKAVVMISHLYLKD